MICTSPNPRLANIDALLTSLTQIGTFELQMSMVPYCTARNVFVHAGGAPLTKLEADGGDRRTMCP